MYGAQCPKRLWLHKFMPQVKDVESEAQTAIFQQGTDVGLLAQDLFPNGADATPKDYFSYQQSVADTARFIGNGQTIIYEAAFQNEGILCAVDLLIKNNDKWYAYEVKSTNGVKSTHIQDAALQYHVMKQSGLDLADISILHLNGEYIRQGKLDIRQLFCPTSVLAEVIERQDAIALKIEELKNVIKLKVCPEVEMGSQCNNPYTCNFTGHCSKNTHILQPDHGEVFIDKTTIREFTSNIAYPIHFMDFETWMTAVPLYDGHWPYRQVSFQYSLHVEDFEGAPLKHHAYLAQGPHTPQREFIDNLLIDLGTEGSILVYNLGFENARLNELKNEFPELKDAINAVQGRLIDLMPIFRKHYRLPEMESSYSIKKVLPALIPDMGYDTLAVGNGGAAFFNLKDENDEEKINEVRTALLKYCGLDTLAMVKLLKRLKEL